MDECEEHNWGQTEFDGVVCWTCAKQQTKEDIANQAFIDGYSAGREVTKRLTTITAKHVARELITDEVLLAKFIETLVTQLNRKDRNKPYCPICEELHDFPAKCWAEQQDKEIPDGN